MAISRAQLLKELLPALNEVFGLEYEKDLWAVYFNYNPKDMTRKVWKIMPWNVGAHKESMHRIAKIKAIDEMDAYKKFMSQSMTVFDDSFPKGGSRG